MIGENIRKLREELKLSRREFGDKIGVSGDVINNWERERVKIPEMSIKLIAATYRVSEEWLHSGVGPMFNSLADDPFAIAERLADEHNSSAVVRVLLHAIARAFSELDEETAQRLVNDTLSEIQVAASRSSNNKAEPTVNPQSPADSSSSVS